MFAYFRKDLPNIKDISGSNLGGSTTYYDRTGTIVLFQDYDAIKRVPVTSSNINPLMKDATIAIEDKNFYHEGAFDVKGIARAGFHDLFSSGGGLQGGSTITQQLVKLNENWTSNRTVTRKVKEIILAVELEREYSKDDILTGYLNIAPYGGIEYGAEAAAEDYFGTTAAKLTLPQAAMLAAIPQSPDIYSPHSPDFDKVLFLDRYNYILDQMVSQGYISKADATAAKAVDVISTVQPETSKYDNIKAPYFVEAAKNELQNKYGTATVNRGGWKVITTLDMGLQTKAEQIVSSNQKNALSHGADEAALVLENVPTGQMYALVGGTDFNNPDHGQINYAQTLIPPGSSFKPYDYASLINDTTNTGAGSVLYDVQQPLPGYPCTNKTLPPPHGTGNCLEDYDFRYPGPLTLRYALGGSRNVPAVKAMLTVGTNDVIGHANAMMGTTSGYNCYSDVTLTTTTQCYGASAIGDGAYLHLDQHVNGLSTLARNGQEIPQTYILKITDSSGKVIDQWTQPKPNQVIKPDAAYIVDNMLSDPKASYLPGSCTATNCSPLSSFGYKFQRYNGWDNAVKTGTTNNGFDGLMMSFNTQFAVGSWVGYHTRNVALTGSMEYSTEPLTRAMIQAATDTIKTPPVNWVQPSDIKVLPAYVIHSHVGIGSEEPSPSTDLFPSWYVGSSKTSTTSQTIDKVSGGLATSCTPDAAKQTSSNTNDNAFSADIFYPPNQKTGSTSTTTTSTDTVHSCSDSPPSYTISSIPPNSCYEGTSCTINVSLAKGTHPLNDPTYPQFPATFTLYVNGQSYSSVQPQNGNQCDSGGNACNLTIAFTPSAAQQCQTLTFTGQVTDSVLYNSSPTSNASTTIEKAGGASC
jgi:membrane peptidoglycan carboxypeptidase